MPEFVDSNQIHHAPKRMHKNYCEVFAIWDWLFGTLYIPERLEQFEIGLEPSRTEDGVTTANPHGTLSRAYLVPATDCYYALKNKFAKLMKTGRRVD